MTARTASAGRTRERLLRAAQEGFAGRRYDDVTLADVAGAAGVSVQTLLNHFGSKEGLLAAAAEMFAGDVAELRGPVRPGDVDGAVDALLSHYELLGDATWRFVADADRQTTFRIMIDGGRAEHRRWLESVFGAGLPADEAARDDAIAALYAITDVGTWKLLRRDLGLSPERTRAVLRALIGNHLRGESS